MSKQKKKPKDKDNYATLAKLYDRHPGSDDDSSESSVPSSPGRVKTFLQNIVSKLQNRSSKNDTAANSNCQSDQRSLNDEYLTCVSDLEEEHVMDSGTSEISQISSTSQSRGSSDTLEVETEPKFFRLKTQSSFSDSKKTFGIFHWMKRSDSGERSSKISFFPWKNRSDASHLKKDSTSIEDKTDTGILESNMEGASFEPKERSDFSDTPKQSTSAEPTRSGLFNIKNLTVSVQTKRTKRLLELKASPDLKDQKMAVVAVTQKFKSIYEPAITIDQILKEIDRKKLGMLLNCDDPWENESFNPIKAALSPSGDCVIMANQFYWTVHARSNAVKVLSLPQILGVPLNIPVRPIKHYFESDSSCELDDQTASDDVSLTGFDMDMKDLDLDDSVQMPKTEDDDHTCEIFEENLSRPATPIVDSMNRITQRILGRRVYWGVYDELMPGLTKRGEKRKLKPTLPKINELDTKPANFYSLNPRTLHLPFSMCTSRRSVTIRDTEIRNRPFYDEQEPSTSANRLFGEWTMAPEQSARPEPKKLPIIQRLQISEADIKDCSKLKKEYPKENYDPLYGTLEVAVELIEYMNLLRLRRIGYLPQKSNLINNMRFKMMDKKKFPEARKVQLFLVDGVHDKRYVVIGFPPEYTE